MLEWDWQSSWKASLVEDRDERELEIHMAEYGRLATELTKDTESIDRYLGLYLAAFFAALAFMLQSGTGSGTINYIEEVKRSPDLLFLALLVPIVNGVLVVRIAHLTSQVFARAQHIGARLRPRVIELLETEDLLRWDEVTLVAGRRRLPMSGFEATDDDLPAKRASQWLRVFPAVGFFVLAVGLSITILVLLRSAWNDSPGLAVLYLASWSATFVAAVSGVLLVWAGTTRPNVE